MNLLEFTLAKPEKYWWVEWLGEPVPKARHKRGRGRTYNPSEAAEENVRQQIIATFPEFQRQEPDADHLWGVRCIFYCSQKETITQKGHFRKGEFRRARQITRKRKGGDVDNLQKLILDAANRFLWADDSAVKECYGMIVPSIRPRTEFLFYHLARFPLTDL